MVRPAPSEWEVLDLSDDPTPGDPEILRKLAAEYDSIADDAEAAFSVINRVENEDLGEGKSMDKLRETLEELPKQVGQLRDSYRRAAEALQAYVPKLEAHQEQADRALADGKEARSSLDLALAALDAAGANLSTLENADPPPPDDAQARNAVRDAMDRAQAERNTAQGDVDSSQSKLDAAKRLASDAQELRESDAATASNELDDAKGDAVKKKSWWDGFWDEIIGLVIGIVALVVAVVCLVIPGLFIIGIGVGLALGFAGLGMGIAKGRETGEWDVTGIVLSALGIVATGVVAVSAAAQLPGMAHTLKSVGNIAKNFFKPSPKPPASPAPSGSSQSGIPLDDLPPTGPPSPTGTPPPTRPPSPTGTPPPRPTSSTSTTSSADEWPPWAAGLPPSPTSVRPPSTPSPTPSAPSPTSATPPPTRPPSPTGTPPPRTPTPPPTPTATPPPNNLPGPSRLDGPIPPITQAVSEYIGVGLAAGGVGYGGRQLNEARKNEKEDAVHA